jgi:hypothetical protein
MFTRFFYPEPVSFHQCVGRHRTFEWCRIQLSCLLIPNRHKTSEIPVSKDTYSVAPLVAALPYKPEGRLIDSDGVV